MVWYDNGSSKNVSTENQGIGQRRPVCRQPRISQSVNVNHFPALGSQLVWGAKAKQRQTTQHHETTHCHETGFSTTTSTLLGSYQVLHSLSYCDFVAIKFVKVLSDRNLHDDQTAKKDSQISSPSWLASECKHALSCIRFIFQFLTSPTFIPRLFMASLLISTGSYMFPQLLVSQLSSSDSFTHGAQARRNRGGLGMAFDFEPWNPFHTSWCKYYW
jgi:hypothetical protein